MVDTIGAIVIFVLIAAAIIKNVVIPHMRDRRNSK